MTNYNRNIEKAINQDAMQMHLSREQIAKYQGIGREIDVMSKIDPNTGNCSVSLVMSWRVAELLRHMVAPLFAQLIEGIDTRTHIEKEQEISRCKLEVQDNQHKKTMHDSWCTLLYESFEQGKFYNNKEVIARLTELLKENKSPYCYDSYFLGQQKDALQRYAKHRTRHFKKLLDAGLNKAQIARRCKTSPTAVNNALNNASSNKLLN